ncbi:MAG TPA: glycosyltransferase [Pyrinomonadaceae bacterium]|nr:glycosyltransferase [Pyrinomonadaceae bacterium]
MKLNWFTPLPPARTEIAADAARLLPALAARAAVTLWTNQEDWDDALERHAEVRRYAPERPPWHELNRADATLYSLGNDPRFHSSVWQVSRRHAGFVVLHDLKLQHLFAGIYRELLGDREGYLSLMESHYGAAGRRDARDFWRGRLSTEDIADRYPLTALAVEGALGVFVHTEEAFAWVRDETGLPVARAPLSFAATRRHGRERAARLRGTRPPFRLILFGHLHSNRRVDELLLALAELPEREQFRLDIYGRLWDERHVASAVAAHGLEGLVTIHGFVDADVLEAALRRAHLAVNLRYPTMGEASGSQLRIWDHALPSLVTRVGDYARLPEDAVAHVRPEREVEDIQTHLRAFLADPARFAAMGERGRLRLERWHAPEAYADALLGLVSRAPEFGRRATARELAARAGTHLGLWTNADPADDGDDFSRLAARVCQLLALSC